MRAKYKLEALPLASNIREIKYTKYHYLIDRSVYMYTMCIIVRVIHATITITTPLNLHHLVCNCLDSNMHIHLRF